MTTIVIHTEAELHELLDSLTTGQTVVATWVDGEYHTTVTGPVSLTDVFAYCARPIRFANGELASRLTSFEATVEQTTTATRDDPAALLELVKSLTDGQKVTAEWRSEDGERVAITTGPVVRGITYVDVRDVWNADHTLSERGDLLANLYSVTTTVARTVRWEREA